MHTVIEFNKAAATPSVKPIDILNAMYYCMKCVTHVQIVLLDINKALTVNL